MHPIQITIYAIAMLAIVALLLMWRKTRVEIRQCDFCSQWFDADGNRHAFRPPNSEFLGNSVCPICALPDNQAPRFTLLDGSWDHGSKRTLQQYFEGGATASLNTTDAANKLVQFMRSGDVSDRQITRLFEAACDIKFCEENGDKFRDILAQQLNGQAPTERQAEDPAGMNAFIIVDNLRQLERPKEAFRALVAVSHERMMQDDRFGSQERAPGEFHCILSALQGELARAMMDGSESQVAKAFTQISATAALGLESIIAKGYSE